MISPCGLWCMRTLSSPILLTHMWPFDKSSNPLRGYVSDLYLCAGLNLGKPAFHFLLFNPLEERFEGLVQPPQQVLKHLGVDFGVFWVGLFKRG